MTSPPNDTNSSDLPSSSELDSEQVSKALDSTVTLPAMPRRLSSGEHDVTTRFDALMQLTPDATVLVDSSGRIRLVNSLTQQLFGYSSDELLGQPIEMLVPERWRFPRQLQHANHIGDLEARPIDARLDLWGRNRNGSGFPIDVSLAPIQVDDESMVVASIRDVTQWRQARAAAEAAAEAANQDLRALQVITDIALSHLALDDLLTALLARATSILQVDNATVLLLNASGESLTVRAAHGLEESITPGEHIPFGLGFAGRIAATRQPLVADDLGAFTVAIPSLRERLRSAMGVPLLVGGQLLGVVQLGAAHPRHFSEHDVHLLQQVADRMATAIDRARAYGREQHARETAEAALAQAQISERRYRRLVEGNIIGISVSDGEQILEANDAFLRLVGYTRADLEAGRVRLDTFLTPDSNARSRRAHREALANGVSVPTEREYVRKDGSYVPALAGVTLLQHDPIRYVTFALDLSERKQLEREREVAKARELAAQEVAQQLDSFFAVAAHDIRTPITVVSGYTQVARRRAQRLADDLTAGVQTTARSADLTAKAVEGVRDALRNVQVGVDRLQRLVDYLFDVARARTGTLRVTLAPLDLVAMVRATVTAQQAAMPERSVDLETPVASVMVQADVDRLDQALNNYLTNALKYSPADQRVTVRLEVANQRARVSVIDRGPGLEPAEQRQIWELFHRAPGVETQPESGKISGSLGLGLYISKQLVELHPGGRVGVESALGQGSIFWFELPLAS
jgi:PAS domain S-box-containing protein